ncbi:MAG: DUF1800 domain-containing protein [Acidimicrobiales bacterium]
MHTASVLLIRRRPTRVVADTRSAVAHLVRRAAFGAPPEEIDALSDLGYEGAVAQLCDLVGPDPAADAIAPPTFDTAGYLAARDGDEAARREANRIAATERRALPLWWVRRMAAAQQPLHEKLTLLWHDHFATSLEKVKVAELLYWQRQTLYDLGPGRFDDLVHAVARDPAMLVWLDGRENEAGAPNENFARELLELFTLGHGTAHPGHARQPYTEDDVANAARALTGWTIARTGKGALVPRRHDAGVKTLLGVTGPLGLDEVVAATTSNPACAPHVVARLWSRLARPAGPDDPVVQELSSGFAQDLDVAELLRRLFLHPEFLAPATRTALVKTPVDLVVGIARTFRIAPDERVVPLLAGLGQLPFLPPDVSGWPANEAWLSTASTLLRLQLASVVAERVATDDVVGVRPEDRPATLARLLGVERWGTATTAALRTAADPKSALTIALVAPEHLVG